MRSDLVRSSNHYALIHRTTDILRQVAVINLTGIITDMFWTSPWYHESSHYDKIWLVVIIFEHR